MQPTEPAEPAQPVQPQQHEEASMPVAAPEAAKHEPPPPADPWPTRASGLGYALVGGLGLGFLETDLAGSKQRTTGGGLFFHLAGSGFTEAFSLSGRVTGLFGGGSGGQETMLAAHVFVGGGAAIGNHSQLFARLGAEGHSLKNDEIEAASSTVIGGQLGFQTWLDGFGFELAPRFGMSPRTEYEPGDESAGRRHWRRLAVRPAVGGSALVTVEHVMFIDVSLGRVLDSDPVDVADGRVCLVPFYIALCGIGQYWKSVATVPTGPASVDVPTTYLGFALGVGAAGSGAEKLFGSTSKPPPRPPPPR